ncbi:MAG: hypothetical protein EOR30_17040 [Mesorhizobium sp.]|uniref:phage pre-tape measure protein n=1 Tax=unclassified Mesorhizobium TaxID=325217 RepID=UPI000FCA6F59|nr:MULTISPECIES: hypothetical protein [unclassified Mesorhizobium]RUV75927.1 hypothetical protein EOA78_04815 [Mesorhizobium sp. M5C.F.Cr.IN.023.01.1.1]RWF85786.1 MAG: hypothetical protein EOQ36_20995 [Mesorhizobium sp.]RWF95284.1 MAG: hypothetical protein EOQ45_08105 [Mesorhizobium sp.]RWI39882.1 MAG: hypothetical protein EOR14_17545 [Mesorhizobium sp.]RWI45253.1 MAG: hypothetical protein EOR15_22495 [Mesorhizobium sp.]
MVGLLDIAPLTERVPVGNATVEVFGVSAKGVVSLLARFPEVRMLMVGKDVGIDKLMEMGGDAIAAIIAAGIGFPGDEEQEKAAGRLSVEAQADLLTAILKVTLPNGIGPFVEKLTALGATVGVAAAASPRVPATKSPKSSSS